MTESEDLDRAEADAIEDARRESGLDAAEPDPGMLASPDYTTAFTPRNVAVGLAIVAGLVMFAASRRWRRRTRDGEDG